MKNAILAPFVEAIRDNQQRRRSNARRNAGFVATVSARALIILLPTLGSSALILRGRYQVWCFRFQKLF